jgi:hypothetical protein
MNKLNIQLTIDELNLIIESLGGQPYMRVYNLIENIQKQATEQLSAATSAAAGTAKQEAKNGAAAN